MTIKTSATSSTEQSKEDFAELDAALRALHLAAWIFSWRYRFRRMLKWAFERILKICKRR